MAVEEATADRGAATLGTNPWAEGGAAAGAVQLRERSAAFAALFDRLLRAAEEAPRLREVVRRLERRVAELDAALKAEHGCNREAARRLDSLIRELETWKPSEPSPSTSSDSG